jgi:small subunit ribosomal protein S18
MDHARPLTRRRETCPFTGPNTLKINKDSKNYVSEPGKIVPSRITAVSAKKAAQLANTRNREQGT